MTDSGTRGDGGVSTGLDTAEVLVLDFRKEMRRIIDDSGTVIARLETFPGDVRRLEIRDLTDRVLWGTEGLEPQKWWGTPSGIRVHDGERREIGQIRSGCIYANQHAIACYRYRSPLIGRPRYDVRDVDDRLVASATRASPWWCSDQIELRFVDRVVGDLRRLVAATACYLHIWLELTTD